MKLTEENIDNCILALDRGEFSPARLNDEHDKFVAALNHRMNQSDFKLLPPQVQEMYQVRIDQHNQLMAEQTAQLKAMQSEFIPTGGALVTCSVQIPDKATGKPKQLRLPYESLMHLVKILDSQGMSMDMLEQMDQQQQVDVLQKAAQLMNQPQAPASGQMQEYSPSEPLMMI